EVEIGPVAEGLRARTGRGRSAGRLVLLAHELADVTVALHRRKRLEELLLGHLREFLGKIRDADLAVDFLEDVAEIAREVAGLTGGLHQAFAGLREDRSAIHDY